MKDPMLKIPSIRDKSSKYCSYRRNIMSPLNWFFSIMGSVFFYGVIKSTELWVKIFSATLIAIFVLFYLGTYLYNLLKDPQRLQTEGSNLEQKELDCLLSDSVKETSLTADTISVSLVKNEQIIYPDK